MLADVKKYADNRDSKSLRYIFADCLDVDPTFEKYKEEYEYCKKAGGLFDAHLEMSGMTEDKSRWNEDYWVQLKLDLVKNFSEKRFEHMVDVAKVVYADKVARLTNARSMKTAAALPKMSDIKMSDTKVSDTKAADTIVSGRDSFHKAASNVTVKSISISAEDERRIAERQREIEENNRRAQEKERADRARIEARKREARIEAQRTVVEREREDHYRKGDASSSKKVPGVLLIAAILLILAVIVIVML